MFHAGQGIFEIPDLVSFRSRIVRASSPSCYLSERKSDVVKGNPVQVAVVVFKQSFRNFCDLVVLDIKIFQTGQVIQQSWNRCDLIV